MIRWRFYEPSPMRDLLEQMVQMAGPSHGRGEPMPINVHQPDSEVVIEAGLPGVRPEDIDVNWSDGILSIRAHSSFEERDYLHQEMRSVEFMRQVAMPLDVRFEEANAHFDHGVLEIRIPKARPRPPERIQIAVNRGQGGGTTIDARRGKGYEEVGDAKSAAPKPAAKATPKPRKPASKKASGGGAGARRASPGSRSEPSR
jgi:HSP20 family protein